MVVRPITGMRPSVARLHEVEVEVAKRRPELLANEHPQVPGSTFSYLLPNKRVVYSEKIMIVVRDCTKSI